MCEIGQYRVTGWTASRQLVRRAVENDVSKYQHAAQVTEAETHLLSLSAGMFLPVACPRGIVSELMRTMLNSSLDANEYDREEISSPRRSDYSWIRRPLTALLIRVPRWKLRLLSRVSTAAPHFAASVTAHPACSWKSPKKLVFLGFRAVS